MVVQYNKEGAIATIKLNRPESYNSVNTQLAHELIVALKDAREDNAIRVVCLTGIGKAFCAGQDLKEATDPEAMPGFRVLLEEHYGPIIKHIVKMPKPVVVAVNGVAAGAGANIALAGDIIVARESASFIQAFSAIGLVPDSGGTYHLPRLVGRAKAMAYAMLGEKVEAKEAERVGMIYRFYPDDTFDAEVQKLLERLANMPTAALALIKDMINNTWQYDLDNQLDLETEAQIESAMSDDYKEGVAAFLEKRKPNFCGK